MSTVPLQIKSAATPILNTARAANKCRQRTTSSAAAASYAVVATPPPSSKAAIASRPSSASSTPLLRRSYNSLTLSHLSRSCFHSTAMSSADPYTEKASQQATPQQKLDEVHAIVKEVKTGMLVSVNPDGSLHSRAMAPVSEEGLIFDFIANNQSGKFEELESNPQVNIAFYGPDSTNWVSVSGRAKVTNDTEKIKALWNPAIKAWFGDLKDGVHKGDYTDPRVSLIEVIPSEVRYWQRTTSKIGQAVDVAKGAVTGETASPGHLRQISGDELKLFRKQ